MKKAIFLASLAVMTASVFGMKHSLDQMDEGQPKIAQQIKKQRTDPLSSEIQMDLTAVQPASDMVNVTETEEIIRDIVSSNDPMVIRNFFGKLLYIHDQIFVCKEKFGIEPKGMTPEEKHTWECLLCLFVFRSKILSNDIYPFLLMYKNKTPVNPNDLREYIEGKVKNSLEYTIKKDFLHVMVKNSKINLLDIMLHYGADINKEESFTLLAVFLKKSSWNIYWK